ncbi:carbohydrate kinase [Alicyclobacillus cellulosilyticus]|uniref:Carbohydrate kinase n=1 Tax=Alicyclobacillus cellulosilyticus TaxID=1003997 RepID=A0A917KA63_9BACL|nr:rhamnulokinase family protein [Alicyclobacillus cellulosilyticus]GGJ04936.1 carbohydrate kinase [Alicyclobacillus cellulosilyticus]
MKHVVAVDVGASSGKAFLVSYDGSRMTVQEVHRFPNEPVSVFGRLYWDIYRIFGEIRSGLLRAGAQVKEQGGELTSAGIDTWAVDFGLLDVRGYLLDLPRHYRDARTQAVFPRVVDALGGAYIFARTGIQLMPINTIYQLVAAREENPALLEAADRLLLIPDLLDYFLTGEVAAEFTNATTTQLLHPGTRDWDEELLQAAGIPRRLLPPVAPPGQVIGPPAADPELRADGMCSRVLVVRVASHDTASAVVAVPVAAEPYAFISSGTWSLLGTTVAAPVLSMRAQRFNFTNEGGVGNYRLLKNIMGLWLLQETQRTFAQAGLPHALAELLARAESAPPFAALFDPDDPRLLFPGDIPARIRDLCRAAGEPPPDDPGAMVRAILESLALKYRLVLAQLEQILGQRVAALHIVGGGSQNRLLCQWTADATGRPVYAGPVEASAVGNALVQLAALGEVRGSAEMRELVRRSFPVAVYWPTSTAAWDAAYERFCRLTAGSAAVRPDARDAAGSDTAKGE